MGQSSLAWPPLRRFAIDKVNKTIFHRIVRSVVKIKVSMQPRKSTKMTAPEAMEEPRVTPETVVGAAAKKAAAPRKRSAKLAATAEPAAVRKSRPATHRASTPASPAPERAMAAAAAAGSVAIAAADQMVAGTPARGVSRAPGTTTDTVARPYLAVTEDRIAELAYFYWLDRGCQHGNAHEDWLRAENALRANAN